MAKHLFDLPPEIVLMIYEHLEGEHLAHAKRFCKLSKVFVDSNAPKKIITTRKQEVMVEPVITCRKLLHLPPFGSSPPASTVITLHPALWRYWWDTSYHVGTTMALCLNRLLELDDGVSSEVFISQPPMTYLRLDCGDDDDLSSMDIQRADGLRFKDLQKAAAAWWDQNKDLLQGDHCEDGQDVVVDLETLDCEVETSMRAKSHKGMSMVMEMDGGVWVKKKGWLRVYDVYRDWLENRGGRQWRRRV